MLQYFKITLEAEYNNLNIWYFVSFIYGIIAYFCLILSFHLQQFFSFFVLA
ncbi:comEC/Rec2 family domain protein [Rickettsia felis str. Pedreira]|uniref:ComEC/Rec2 family domain protein n=1 Tax=Rickettsia felis str. Pedreira TaxID=1359196 RepID=A0A0F3MS07_RICFI|nr:comEC/Rec2 family domain protein [Rickettsia felis str. Pedreira]